VRLPFYHPGKYIRRAESNSVYVVCVLEIAARARVLAAATRTSARIKFRRAAPKMGRRALFLFIADALENSSDSLFAFLCLG
jgi:hypothetical protein